MERISASWRYPKTETRHILEEPWKQKKMTEPPKMVHETNWNILLVDDAFYASVKGGDLPHTITTPKQKSAFNFIRPPESMPATLFGICEKPPL